MSNQGTPNIDQALAFIRAPSSLGIHHGGDTCFVGLLVKCLVELRARCECLIVLFLRNLTPNNDSTTGITC